MMVSWNFKDFHGVRPYQCTRGQKRWLLWLCLTVVSIFVCYCYWHFQWHCVYCHHVSHQVGSQRIPCIHCTLLGVSIVIGVPQNRLFIMENRIKMDDLGIPPFQETSYMIVEAYHTGHIHVLVRETSVLFCGFRHVSFPLNDFIFSRGVERLTSQFLWSAN